MAVTERRAVHPRLEGGLVAPAGDDEPRGPVVGGLEQLEALEAVLVVDRPGSRCEALGQLVAAPLGNGDGVDLDDLRHGRHARAPTGWWASRCSASGTVGQRGGGVQDARSSPELLQPFGAFTGLQRAIVPPGMRAK